MCLFKALILLFLGVQRLILTSQVHDWRFCCLYKQTLLIRTLDWESLLAIRGGGLFHFNLFALFLMKKHFTCELLRIEHTHKLLVYIVKNIVVKLTVYTPLKKINPIFCSKIVMSYIIAFIIFLMQLEKKIMK